MGIAKHIYTAPTNPHPPPNRSENTSLPPLKGEEHNDFPPLQGEGKGGGGVNQMSIQLWTG